VKKNSNNAINFLLREPLFSIADLIRISEYHCNGTQNDHFHQNEASCIDKIIGEALIVDDVLIAPCYSEVTPDMGDIPSFLTPSIRINIPLISSPIDTVAEASMAMAMTMAKNGGVGVIQKNMPIESQKKETEKVKQWQITDERGEYPRVCQNDREELIVGERSVWEWIAYRESKHYPLSVEISSLLTQPMGTLPMSFVLSARSKQLGQTAS
jgi:hypothetical protein